MSIYIGGTSSAHEFDDYEEGTWTPGLDGATYGGNSYGYNTRTGNYIKIGRMVQCNFYLNWGNFNGTGPIMITGLPFSTTTSNNAQFAGPIMTDGLNWPKNGTVVTHNWYGISFFRLYVSDDNGGWSAIQCDGSASIIGTLNYMTN
jgi:hypothetical protein